MSSLYERSVQDPEWASIFDRPDEVNRRHLVADGYHTTYLEAGREDAAPVVLIHGANFQVGIGADRWYPTILPLARRFRVFAVDELGGGGTDAPRNLQDIGDVRVRADHVVAFVEALGVGPCHLVGQSQGAWIAAYVAFRRPDLVRELVLVDSASLALPAGGIGAARVSPQFTQNFAPGTLRTEHLAPTPQDMRRYMGSMTYDHSMLCDPLIDRMVALAKKWLPIWEAPFAQFWADGGVRNRAQYEVDGVHLTTHLETMGKQPLIVWGKNSGKGLENGLDFYRRIPDAQFHVFDKADHFLWLDRWKDFNSLVTWFLSRT